MIAITANKTLWWVFYLLLGVIVVDLVALVFGVMLEANSIFRGLLLGLPGLLLLLHSFLTLSFFRGTGFILLAASTGLIMETWGLHGGTIFGGQYVYAQNQMMMFFVPVSVVLYWAVFIYTGYCVVTSFLVWIQKTKPSLAQRNYWLVPLLCIADGFVVMAIDLFMDPIQVYQGSWTWLDGGAYFGVPLGNFIGWFLVTTLVTGLFRSYEYWRPQEREFDRRVYLIPVVGYGMLALGLALTAITYGMFNLAVVGSLCMLPVAACNLFLFCKYSST